MAAIPAGRYTMGETKKDVTIAPFYLDVTEVSVSAYKACVSSGRCTAPNADDPKCNWENADRLRHPINCVDWAQASDYCAAFGKRLPTEEEWEWAARGGSKAWAYPWGSAPPADQVCWNGKGNTLGEGRRESTCAVGTFLTGTNAWEVHDLSGNVWEWTASAFEGTNKRVVRGGSWHTLEADRLSTTYRFRREPEERDFLLGFRCAL
jgi:formylglycine-generating enzyme required for sulfatase activity